MSTIPFYYQLSSKILDNLTPAKPGPRISKKYDSFYLDIPETGRFPLRLRFEKTVKRNTDQVYHVKIFRRKHNRRKKGRGYATDFLEITFYVRDDMKVEALRNHGGKILTMDFCWFKNDQQIRFKPWPERIWRLEGMENRGALYAYSEKCSAIYKNKVLSRAIMVIPVRISFVDVALERANSTAFPKYRCENSGIQAVYDRRRDCEKSTGLMEIIKAETADPKKRHWIYANLKDQSVVPDDSPKIISNNNRTALIVCDSVGNVLNF